MLKNRFEQKCFESIKKIIPDLQVYLFDCTTTINEVRIKNNLLNKNLLFLECETSKNNLTEKGNSIKKEFMLYLPNNSQKIWIECRYLSKPTLYRDFTYGEFVRSENYDGELWIVFFGDGFTEKTLEQYKTEVYKRGLVGKIKLLKGIEELEFLLHEELQFYEVLG